MSQKKTEPSNSFPEDFLWGAATAAHQVEGGQHNDWSDWEASVADKLADGAKHRLINEVPDWPSIEAEASNPSNYISGDAADHYNRFAEDFDIMKKLSLNAYRFSIEWARIEPEPGQYDRQELDHYKAVVEALKERGIEPLITLHHFTNPTWLEEHGGWHGKEVVDRFVKFSEVVATHLGSDSTYWCTINEPGSYLLQRYLGGGAWPEWPIMAMDPLNGYRYLRNVVKAHKGARHAIQAVNPDVQVGMAHGLIDFQLGRHDPFSWLFKKQLDYIPDGYLLHKLKNHIDYIGVNYYMRMVVKAGFTPPQAWALKWNGKDPRNDMGWGIYPEGMYNITQRMKKYNKPQLITENGIPDAADRNRAENLREIVENMARSRADGADIRGYFHWSLIDNYEWTEGFWPKFGLVAVDHDTKQRTVRPSALEYAEIIKNNSKNISQ